MFWENRSQKFRYLGELIFLMEILMFYVPKLFIKKLFITSESNVFRVTWRFCLWPVYVYTSLKLTVLLLQNKIKINLH